MPSVSEKQRRFMAAAAHDAAFAAKMGIPVSVAREFHAADVGVAAAGKGKPDRSRLVRELVKGR